MKDHQENLNDSPWFIADDDQYDDGYDEWTWACEGEEKEENDWWDDGLES